MKIIRFKTENNHIDYINYKSEKVNIINENIEYMNNDIIESKIEILANISKNWNDELQKEYYNIKSLYKYDIVELKEIRKTYIIKTNKNDVEEKKEHRLMKKLIWIWRIKMLIFLHYMILWQNYR